MATSDMSVGTSAELDAVNDILAAIGESPVSTLEGDSNADVASARRILQRLNRQIQSRGWTFNIEESAVLTPDVYSNLITYQDDFLRVLSASGASAYVNRGGYLYDRTSGTDLFSSSITVNLIRLRDYDEMPECFRTWIVAKAARQFNNSFFGATEVDGLLQEEEDWAYQMCFEYELDFGAYNMLDGDSFTSGLLTR